MSRERNSYDDKSAAPPNGAAVLEAETLRSVAAARHDEGKGEEKMSVFWRVFGGTILSIVALVCVTAYNSFNTSLTDLRRDVNQHHEARGDMVKKDEFNNRLSALWNKLGEQHTLTTAVSTLNERFRLLDQQMDKQVKLADDERREQLRKREEQRKAVEEERKEWARKLEETRKVAEDERRELSRRLDDQQRTFAEERRELTQKLQALGERLASVEGRQGVRQAVNKAPAEK